MNKKISYITTCEDPPSKVINNSQLQINNNLRQKLTLSSMNQLHLYLRNYKLLDMLILHGS